MGVEGWVPGVVRGVCLCWLFCLCGGWALAPNAAHGRECFFDGTGVANRRGMCGELRVFWCGAAYFLVSSVVGSFHTRVVLPLSGVLLRFRSRRWFLLWFAVHCEKETLFAL